VSIWVSVYCRKRTETIRPARLVAAIKERASHFSELYAQEDPEETFSRLHVQEYKRGRDLPLLHLHYLADGPPIVIDRITRADEVAGDVQEYLEYCFKGRRGQQATLVRRHLGGTVEIISFCLKQRHADGMGTPLTYAAAAWLADEGDGLVRIDEQGWARPTERGDFIIILPE
jgi:hypothetical protein